MTMELWVDSVQTGEMQRQKLVKISKTKQCIFDITKYVFEKNQL